MAGDHERASFASGIYPRVWAWIAALLFACSRASLPLCLFLVLVADDPPITPPVLARLLAVLVLAPGLAARLIGRACAAQVVIADGALVATRRGFRLEVPLASIERVALSVLPLHALGCSLLLRSGRWLEYVIAADDPAALLAALGDAGVVSAVHARRQPLTIYAAARRAEPCRVWQRPLLKFVLFSLPWGALFFNLDQHISFGGSFGQYYLQGLGPYLENFALHWGGMMMYLLLFASVWRGVAEAIAWSAAVVAPSLASRVRRAVEIACTAIYYAGVPLFVVLRFLR